MTLQQLIYFREVADTRNFTKASKNLNVTQSALSYSIISLERELELPLFIRSCGRKIELTSYGSVLLPMAEQAISSMEKIEETMRRIRDPHAGVVNIAFSYVNGWRFVPQMLRAFREEAPEDSISVQLNVNHTRNNFEEDVLKGSVDIAFSCLAQMEGLTTVPFAQQQLYAALPPGHPLAERESLTVSEIADEQLVGYHRGRNLDQWISQMFEKEGLRPNTIEYTDDWSAQITKVSVGEGISVMQKVPAAEDSVVFVPLRGDLSQRTVYMMWASDRKLSDAAEFARDYFLDYRGEIGTV